MTFIIVVRVGEYNPERVVMPHEIPSTHEFLSLKETVKVHFRRHIALTDSKEFLPQDTGRSMTVSSY